MKVKCINISRYNKYDNLPLTVGKVYDVIKRVNIYDDYAGPFYELINDIGEVSGYTDECVRPLTLDEERELTLIELLKPMDSTTF